MSHVVEIEVRVHNAEAVQRACRRMGLEAAVEGNHRLYSGEVAGLGVQLPGWQYPAVFDLNTGKGSYDNYNGAWGAQEHLDGFLQAYACEAVKLEAENRGCQVSEQVTPEGEIVLEVVGGY